MEWKLGREHGKGGDIKGKETGEETWKGRSTEEKET